MFLFLWQVVMIPGLPFVFLLSKFKQLGDGNGNETKQIEFVFWATIFGIIVWVFIVAGGMWAWNNLVVSFSFK